MRYAIIENKQVVNVIVADQDFIDANCPDAIECDDVVSVGWSYNNKKFIAPELTYYTPDEAIPE